MKTAMECVPTRHITTDHGRTPEPHFRQSWSRLRKLQWHASLVMADYPGVRLYVQKGRSWTNDIFNYGEFQISYNNGGLSPAGFDAAWRLITGIRIGLQIAARKHTEDSK